MTEIDPVPMTDRELKLSKMKLKAFFPSTFSLYQHSTQILSFPLQLDGPYHTVCSRVIVRFPSGLLPMHPNAKDVKRFCLRGLGFDFTEGLHFTLQIHFSNKAMFHGMYGAQQGYFYTDEPAKHEKRWTGQVQFKVPCGTRQSMETDIPHLRENGMGLYFFEKHAVQDLRERWASEVKLDFRFAKDQHQVSSIPKRFTLYLFRQ